MAIRMRSARRLVMTLKRVAAWCVRRLRTAKHRRQLRSHRFQKLPRARSELIEAQPSRSLPRTASDSGVEVVGFFRGQFGLGQAARSYAAALLETGRHVVMREAQVAIPHETLRSAPFESLHGTVPCPIVLIFVNPDHFDQAIAAVASTEEATGKYLIGCWFWELDRIPDAWRPAVERVDEMLVASPFVAQAFARLTDKPITCLPVPVSIGDVIPVSRSDFGLQDDTFIVLTAFDFHSEFERKNPLAAIAAFQRAFPEPDLRVQLIVKTSHAEARVADWQRLVEAAAGDPRILLRDHVIHQSQMRALQQCCDVFVSLHRAEGFGLLLAECMAMGKPVVATGWSGNLAFMTETNSCLVGAKLVPVPQGMYPHGSGCMWADPDIPEAGRALRMLFDDERRRAEIGRAARAVADLLSPARVADALDNRLATIGYSLTTS
ncbi:glycosyltransferase family 4 protein [Tolypothrix campylonemoides VB511288]|nr:glycosyltransferase family 4 protein [Tolypothrix campylonemoides VB511288]